MSDVKKSKCQEKLFFPSVLKKKMNDKRNLICGNVMLLSQSRGEIFFVYFCKKKLRKTWFESETEKKMFDLKKNALVQRLLINTSFMTWSPCCDRMKLKSNSGVESH